MSFIRQKSSEKNITIKWIRSHQGNIGNEAADHLAKEATKLPVPPAPTTCPPWSIIVNGRIQANPVKTWVRPLLPAHSHNDISDVSWAPLRRGLPLWPNWLLGLLTLPGFDAAPSYWIDYKKQCAVCRGTHNLSVHGVISFCGNDSPWVRAWYDSWPAELYDLMVSWRSDCDYRSKYLLGKLAIPVSLVEHLRAKLGTKRMKKAVRHFHSKAVANMKLLMDLIPP